MQMDKICFCHFIDSDNLIFTTFVHTPHNSLLIIGVGKRILKIICSEAKKWQKQSLVIAIFAITPFSVKIERKKSTNTCYEKGMKPFA
jgi:hypothetical protein